jgi:hypothetical protein
MKMFTVVNIKSVSSIIKKEDEKMARDIEVLCEVENCNYWGQGNRCQADAIYVVSHKGNTAHDSKDTDCKTFKPAH